MHLKELSQPSYIIFSRLLIRTNLNMYVFKPIHIHLIGEGTEKRKRFSVSPCEDYSIQLQFSICRKY